MEVDKIEAQAIISELSRLHKEAKSLIDEGDAVREANSSAALELKARLSSFKQEIKEAARHGTLSRQKTAQTELEQCFFAPAVQAASANLKLSSSTAPTSPTWSTSLYDVELEFSHYVDNLTEALKEG
jgi:DNA repair exonuclease SbcCD nuclease subunit